MEESGEQKAVPGPSGLAAFAGSCTLHGLSHVFLPGPLTPRRVAWAVAVLAAVGMFLYQAAERVQYYKEYHHVTMLDEVEGKRLIFPAVSLCNFNRIRKSQLTHNDLHWLGQTLLGVEPSDTWQYLQALGLPAVADSVAFDPSLTFDMQEFLDRAGHRLEEMLLECRFGTRVCGPENFTAVSPVAREWGWGAARATRSLLSLHRQAHIPPRWGRAPTSHSSQALRGLGEKPAGHPGGRKPVQWASCPHELGATE
uniref:Acid-sensing ion channel 3 n=1 Tax=Salvator merianae TaxID=96440 RepID=A0A8D0DJ41_SALMN